MEEKETPKVEIKEAPTTSKHIVDVDCSKIDEAIKKEKELMEV